jgi:hypothetical protein
MVGTIFGAFPAVNDKFHRNLTRLPLFGSSTDREYGSSNVSAFAVVLASGGNRILPGRSGTQQRINQPIKKYNNNIEQTGPLFDLE